LPTAGRVPRLRPSACVPAPEEPLDETPLGRETAEGEDEEPEGDGASTVGIGALRGSAVPVDVPSGAVRPPPESDPEGEESEPLRRPAWAWTAAGVRSSEEARTETASAVHFVMIVLEKAVGS
jgi:hypothetical protein